MKKTLLSILCAVAVVASAAAVEKPRLVVNVVVSQLSASDLAPLEHNFTQGGLHKLLDEGVRYDYAYYSFAPTTEGALAALSTGATPSMSGVVGPVWWNFTTGARVGVVADPKSSSYDCDTKESRVSNVNLVMPTLGDALRAALPESKSVAVATDPSSAIILGGLNPTQVWWVDSLGANWTTSTKYVTQLPKWVKTHNAEGTWKRSLARPWVLSKSDEAYINERVVEARPSSYQLTKEEQKGKPRSKDLRRVSRSYVANDMVAAFAREAVIYNALGGDEQTDVLTICFDAPARVANIYGIDSREWEDMIYRLDTTLAEMIHFINAQCGGRVVWTLSSDGGAMSLSEDKAAGVFNVEQFMFLAGTYLHANYGKADWILGYDNRSIWLNRDLIRSKGENLEAMQRSLAQFALQYGGVSHAVVQADMVGGGVKAGPAEVVQEGFYPKRSADLVLVLMPGWREVKSEDGVAPKCSVGGVYNYARKALLTISGWGIPKGVVVRKVDPCSLVPTLARLAQVEAPMGAMAEPLAEVFEQK